MVNPVNPSPIENLAKLVSDYNDDIGEQVMAKPIQRSEIECLAKLVCDFHDDFMEQLRESVKGLIEHWPAHGITESDIRAMEEATNGYWEIHEKLVEWSKVVAEKAGCGDDSHVTTS